MSEGSGEEGGESGVVAAAVLQAGEERESVTRGRRDAVLGVQQ